MDAAESESESLLPNNKPTNNRGPGFFNIGYLRRRRRRYHRIDDGGAAASSIPDQKKITRLRRGRRNRYWIKIRSAPKLRWVIKSPLKILSKIKNAYINFMLKSINTDNYIFRGKRIPQQPNYYSTHAFEARLIYEISKALVASHELYPM